MRRVEWSDDAGAAFEADLAWLVEHHGEDVAARQRQIIETWTQRVADQLLGTPHQWRGCRSALSRDGYKRIIYRAADDHIVIVAFRDTRQDNRAYGFVQPRTRS